MYGPLLALPLGHARVLEPEVVGEDLGVAGVGLRLNVRQCAVRELPVEDSDPRGEAHLLRRRGRMPTAEGRLAVAIHRHALRSPAQLLAAHARGVHRRIALHDSLVVGARRRVDPQTCSGRLAAVHDKLQALGAHVVARLERRQNWVRAGSGPDLHPNVRADAAHLGHDVSRASHWTVLAVATHDRHQHREQQQHRSHTSVLRARARRRADEGGN
eukprot:scaffold11348_cov52-Phaeocystis_antarctica.AAC.3